MSTAACAAGADQTYTDTVDEALALFPDIADLDGFTSETLKYSTGGWWAREESVDVSGEKTFTGNHAILSTADPKNEEHHRTDTIFNITGKSELKFDSLKVIFDGSPNDYTTGGGNPILFSINRDEFSGTPDAVTLSGTSLEAELQADTGKFFFVEKNSSLTADLNSLYMHAEAQSGSGKVHFFDLDGSAEFNASDRIVGLIENADPSIEVIGMEVSYQTGSISLNTPLFLLVNKVQTQSDSRGIYAYTSSRVTLGESTTGAFILQGFDIGASLENSTLSGQAALFGILDAETGLNLSQGKVDLQTQSVLIDASDAGIRSDFESDVKIRTGMLVITAGPAGYAIDNYDGSVVDITSEQSLVTGAISNDSGTIRLDFGKQSTYEGLTLNWYDSGKTELTFGSDSEWKVAYDKDEDGTLHVNEISSLSLEKARVNLAHANTTAASIKTDRLNGDGSFSLLVDVGEQKATEIHSGSQSEGTFEVSAAFINGSAQEITNEGIFFAEDLSNKVQYTGAPTLTEAGLMVVTPTLTSKAQGDSTLWYISSAKEEVGPTPSIMLEGFENNYLFWRTVADTTKERFGELRNGRSAGVWGRATAGSLQKGSLSNDYQTYRLGADTGIGTHTALGIALEIHEGDLDASSGTGDMQAYAAALYGLWQNGSGMYFDAGLRFGFMDYEFSNHALVRDSYDYTTNLFGGWVEIGLDIPVSDALALTPHAALNYGRMDTESFTTKNGLHAKIDNLDSLIATFGADLSYRLPQFEFALTVALSSETAGNQKVRISNETESIRQRCDYSDTWIDFGLSATYRPSENTQAWINARRSAFADVDEDWRVNFGVRWAFE